MERKFTVLTVEQLSEEDIASIAKNYLAQYGKRLSTDQLNLLLSAEACTNPLYLRTLLEEIKNFTSFETISDEIKKCLQCVSSVELFYKLFARVEAENESFHAVRSILVLLSITKKGLTEDELMGMTEMSRQKWTRLYLGLGKVLSSRSGYISFFHGYVLEAVSRKYTVQQHDRFTIINYFKDVFITS